MATKFSSAPKVNMKTSMVQVAGRESLLTRPFRLSGRFSTCGLGVRMKQNSTSASTEIAAAAR